MKNQSTMRMVGVIDLQGGIVVHAVAGERHAYRPLVSRLCASAEPEVVAGALIGLGLRDLYIADLDAIMGAEPAWDILSKLVSMPVRLWVDAGVRDRSRAGELELLGVDIVVVGLETFPHVEALGTLVESIGDRLVFSLDLRAGRPLAGNDHPLTIAAQAIAAGVRRILVLDLAHVGVGSGTGTMDLCATLVQKYPNVDFAAGGGVRSKEDLEQLRSIGLSAVLLSSALHDGRIGRNDLLSPSVDQEARHS